MRTVLLFIFLGGAFQSSCVAASNDWLFIFVSSGSEWHTVTGSATVQRSGSQFVADVMGDNTVRYRISGTIRGSTVKARFTNLESDFFVKSPFLGNYAMRRDRDITPCGMELITLHDGYNFIGLRRNFHDAKCRP
jgi:hypothetical protein